MPITKARLRISDYNLKRKSRLRSQERRVRMVSLSLTSMVDMFAILVIFLLASSSTTSEWVKAGHGIDLPKAKFSAVPPKAATLQISKDTVYADDKALLSVGQVSQSTEPLRKWLSKLEKRNGYINVVAHQRLPYGVIKRIIGACQDSGFNNVNLAVQPKSN
jgi:biopolymer transport protein ExbD